MRVNVLDQYKPSNSGWPRVLCHSWLTRLWTEAMASQKIIFKEVRHVTLSLLNRKIGFVTRWARYKRKEVSESKNTLAANRTGSGVFLARYIRNKGVQSDNRNEKSYVEDLLGKKKRIKPSDSDNYAKGCRKKFPSFPSRLYS